MKTSSEKQKGRLLFLVLAGFLFLRWHQEIKRAPGYGTEPTYDSEERVNVWLLSAWCLQKAKVPLVLCAPDGRLLPIEEVSLADDRGHALLLAAAALLRASPVTRVTLVKINLSINAAGIFLLAIMLWGAGLHWTSLLSLGLGSRYGLPGPLPGHDAPASYFGVFCLAALAVVWVVSCDIMPYSKIKFGMGSALAFISLAWACLLRQPIGLVGAFTIFLVLLSPLLRGASNWNFELKKGVIGIFLLSAAVNATPVLLRLRNALFHIPNSHAYHSHGIWHALYLGLGWVPNPWGIVWDDRYGVTVVNRITAHAPFGSYDYYRIMKTLYWQIVMENPAAVLSVYGQKFLQTWNFPLFILGFHIAWWFLGSVLVALVCWRSASPGARYPLRMILAFGVLYAAFAAQGVLAIPTGTHLYPLKFCALLMLALWADYAWRLNSSGKRATAGQTAAV